MGRNKGFGTGVSTKLKGKTAIITGASDYLGSGIVLRLTQEGAHIMVNHKNLEGILEVSILVNDLVAMRDFYSKTLLCEPSEILDLKPPSIKIARCRTENVCLNLIEVTEGGVNPEVYAARIKLD